MTTVLIVDDNDTQHELFRCYAFNSSELSLLHAISLEKALNQIASSEPHLIFLDNRLMPYDNYVQTVPQIRDSGYQGTIVVISSDVDEPIFKLANEYQVDHVLDKGHVNLANFDQLVRDYLN